MDETRWLTDDEQHVWRSYLAMEAGLTARLNRDLQTRCGLSLSEYSVLVQLTDTPEERLRPFELADALQWEKSRVSKQIARMVRRELVTREKCDDDGRGTFVVLTPAGRSVLEDAAPGHVDLVRRLLFATLTPAQLTALVTISNAVRHRVEADATA